MFLKYHQPEVYRMKNTRPVLGKRPGGTCRSMVLLYLSAQGVQKAQQKAKV